MAAIAHNTAPATNSIWAPPGLYTVKLIVNGQVLKQPIMIRMDPRVRTPAAGLTLQFELSRAMYDGVLQAQAALGGMRSLRAQVKKIQETAGKAPAEVSEGLELFDTKAAAIEGGSGGPGRRGGFGGFGGFGGGPETLVGISGSLMQLMNMLQAADATPTGLMREAVSERQEALADIMQRWDEFKTKGVASLNALLKQAKLPEIEVER
jgi:hypothetical protein